MIVLIAEAGILLTEADAAALKSGDAGELTMLQAEILALIQAQQEIIPPG